MTSTQPNYLDYMNKDMAIQTASIKRTIHEDSSEEYPASLLSAKKVATGSSANGQNLTLHHVLNASKHGVKTHWISSKSFLVQNAGQIEQFYLNHVAPWLDQNWITVV